MDQLDKALVNAVHAIANKKLQGAVNAAKAAVQNPTPQNTAALERSLQEAQAPVQLAEKIAPNQTVAPVVQKNVNQLFVRIQRGVYNNRFKKQNLSPNNFKNNKNYNNSKNPQIQAMINAHKKLLGGSGSYWQSPQGGFPSPF
jgi:hypothetical protein